VETLSEHAKGLGAVKYKVKIDIDLAINLILFWSRKAIKTTIKDFKDILDQFNSHWKKKIDEYMKEAIGNIEGTLRYYKLVKKEVKITEQNPLLTNYFHEINNKQKSKLVVNGWIMNIDPSDNFASQKGWHYLRRTLVAWGDSVKLRYGDKPEDSPFLWEFITQYVTSMAKVFDGFRLDNAHSTPLHLSKFMLQKARSVNPNLIVMAELFTNSAEADAEYSRQIGLNGLIRELQNVIYLPHFLDL
jgi:glycogen debranching enzyme